MFIQDAVNWTNFDDDVLRFYKAIGVDMIHLDVRSSVSEVDASLGRDLREGVDCTATLERARERVESHGMKLNNIFMSALLA